MTTRSRKSHAESVPVVFRTDRISWGNILQDPFWYTSAILLVGFIGIAVTAFVSLMQLETVIARGWIFLLFTMILGGVLFLHTIFYWYSRLTDYWVNVSIHHAARVNYALSIMWIAITFALAALGRYIERAGTVCCTNEIVGVTDGTLDMQLFVQWHLGTALPIFFLGLLGAIVDAVALTAMLYPEVACKDAQR